MQIDFKELSKHPFWLFAFMVVSLGTVYLQFVLPSKISANADSQERILNATKEQAKLRAELSSLRAAKAFELEPTVKNFLNAQKYEAWATYYDIEEDDFKFIAVNDRYQEKYGVDFIVFGKTVKEAYSVRTDMSKEEIDLLGAYSVNNERALAITSKCIVFNEWVIPINQEPIREKFRKCGMRSGTILMIYGEREE